MQPIHVSNSARYAETDALVSVRMYAGLRSPLRWPTPLGSFVFRPPLGTCFRPAWCSPYLQSSTHRRLSPCYSSSPTKHLIFPHERISSIYRRTYRYVFHRSPLLFICPAIPARNNCSGNWWRNPRSPSCYVSGYIFHIAASSLPIWHNAHTSPPLGEPLLFVLSLFPIMSFYLISHKFNFTQILETWPQKQVLHMLAATQ
jgi:hypothetical protein